MKCPRCESKVAVRHGQSNWWSCPQCSMSQATAGNIGGQPIPDNVNHPEHYTNGDIECIDAIKAQLTDEEFRGYCKGNVVKYIWRERHKGGDESLKKAEWYLKRVTQ